ncbi:MAG: PEP-CTERM sorting domain-containing protein [Armatimonadota bacterium]|jgi:hypothetical protein
MLGHSGVWRLTCAAVVLLLVCGALGYADTWDTIFWQDDFQDGDYTSNPTWTTFGGPGGFTHSVVDTGGGEYVFRQTGTYLGAAGAGWAGAYVSVLEGNQGMTGWVDSSRVTANGWAALSLLRYTPSGIGGFGTGYALAIAHNAADNITATLYRLDDVSTPAITSEVTILSEYSDVWFRFFATGADADTRLQARVWADGSAEPDAWHLDTGVTTYYNTGFGGVGVVTQSEGVLADADFDNIEFGTPEPTTMVLMATGLGAIVLRRRRRG